MGQLEDVKNGERLFLDEVPHRNRKRINHGTKYKPDLGPIIYCFDDDGNELGYYIPDLDMYGTREVDTSTAGRKWSSEFKSRLV